MEAGICPWMPFDTISRWAVPPATMATPLVGIPRYDFAMGGPAVQSSPSCSWACTSWNAWSGVGTGCSFSTWRTNSRTCGSAEAREAQWVEISSLAEIRALVRAMAVRTLGVETTKEEQQGTIPRVQEWRERLKVLE